MRPGLIASVRARERAVGVRREIGACLRLAVPLMLAQLAFVGMSVTDTIMAGHLGGRELAAVALGFALWVPSYLFFMGTSMAVSPFVAQYAGAGEHARIAPYIQQMLYLAAVLAALWGMWLYASGWVIAHLDVKSEIRALSVDYLHAMAWGTPAACAFFVLRFLSEGLGRSRRVLGFALMGLALNAGADYVFMYGALGVPAMGAVGCGWATALTLWTTAAGFYLFLSGQNPERALFRHWQRPRLGVWTETLRIGAPIGVSIFLEASLFAGTALLMARFGGTAVASHQVATNFSAVTFMLPVGLGLATTVRVGQALGRGDPAGARLAGTVGTGLAPALALLPALVMALRPEWISSLYTGTPAVAHQAETFLRLAALYQLWDGLQVTAAGALRGLKDTRMTMIVTFLAYWCVGLPLGAALSFSLEMGPTGLWWGLIAGLFTAAVLLNVRFHRITRP